MCLKMKIHHVGYLVKNIHKACAQFENLGYVLEKGPVLDDWRGIDIVFMVKDGYRIELVAPTVDGSEVDNLRKKVGNAPYHICYEVDNLKKAVDELAGMHFVTWQDPHEAKAIEGRRVTFLMSGQIGLIELLESREEE